MVSFSGVSVSAVDYTLPGSSQYGPYNNVGLNGLLTVYVNVTLINTAPYPKFIIVNPYYDFKVYRNNDSEWIVGYYNPATGEVSHNVSKAVWERTLNYHFGFWIQPYEVVKVQFAITKLHRYYVTFEPYQTNCPGDTGLQVLSYENGTVVGGKVGVAQDLNYPLCGVVYPELLNYPMVINFNKIMLSMDRYIEVLKYNGVVKFTVTNVPSVLGSNGTVQFPVYFALAEPVVFPNAETYDYYPNYTMTYSQYIKEFIWKVRGMNPPKRKPVSVNTTTTLFHLTNTLISGVSVPTFRNPEPREFKFDFPVWIVFMNRQFELTYRVSWTNSGR